VPGEELGLPLEGARGPISVDREPDGREGIGNDPGNAGTALLGEAPREEPASGSELVRWSPPSHTQDTFRGPILGAARARSEREGT
jgi:hypothetical protein